jgi:hypothetical protein
MINKRDEAALRALIRGSLNEMSDPKAVANRTMTMVKAVVMNAQKMLDAIVAGQSESKASNALEASVKELKEFGTFLRNQKAPWTEKVNDFIAAANAMTKKSGFWGRPKFLNVQQHVEHIRELFTKVRATGRSLYSDLTSSIS